MSFEIGSPPIENGAELFSMIVPYQYKIELSITTFVNQVMIAYILNENRNHPFHNMKACFRLVNIEK